MVNYSPCLWSPPHPALFFHPRQKLVERGTIIIFLTSPFSLFFHMVFLIPSSTTDPFGPKQPSPRGPGLRLALCRSFGYLILFSEGPMILAKYDFPVFWDALVVSALAGSVPRLSPFLPSGRSSPPPPPRRSYLVFALQSRDSLFFFFGLSWVAD